MHDELRSSDPRLEPRFPRPIGLLIVTAIVGATALSLAWPTLSRMTTEPPGSGPTSVGVIRRQIDTADSAARLGASAPEFEWNAPDGRTRRLADLRGRVVVVNFWATWCIACREEMPALDQIARQEADLVVLGVNLQEDGAKVRDFLDRYGIVAVQPLLDLAGKTTRRWGVLSLPTTFFLDRQGVVRDVVVGGPMTTEVIRASLAKARLASTGSSNAPLQNASARECNPARMTLTSRRTATLDGRLLAAVRAWRQ